MLVLCVELIHSTALVSQLKALARPNAVEALKEWASRSHLMALTTTQGKLGCIIRACLPNTYVCWIPFEYFTLKKYIRSYSNFSYMSTQGATIADLSVSVTPVENYQLPPEAIPPSSVNHIACLEFYLYIHVIKDDYPLQCYTWHVNLVEYG